MGRFRNLLLFLVFIIFEGGCRKRISDEADHPHYKDGQRFLREGFPERAFAAFFKVIQEIPNAQKSHLEIGQIYLNNYDDPIAAIYHFRRFLAHNSQKQNEKIIGDLIETAKKRFLQQTLGRYGSLYSEHQNFLSLLKHLRDENLQLQTERDYYRNRSNSK
ncbi:MAG: hypothetical protein LBB11_00835 [Puniceicoccales bacterium]|jgi:membrane-associated HD superfamily phosphohydrolase|nr:hypothetical protein [Puniceicoccales bacterium]